jgi:penicillin-binding protein 1B
MVYTEYFVRGSQPIDRCPLHERTSVFDRIASLFGREDPVAASVDALGLPTTATQPVPPAVDDPPQSESTVQDAEKKKKRGFFSRLFGRGKKSDEGKERRQSSDDRRARDRD